MPTILIPRRSAQGPRYAVRGVPFNRKPWDNPVRYKLDRAYGDEFEEASFSALSRRWQMHTAVAADFNFHGGSSIDWMPSAQGSSLYETIPAGDFEAVLEYSVGSGATGSSQGMFGIGMLDANGTGAGFSVYNDSNAYTWGIITWNYSGTGNSVVNGVTFDNRHVWIAVKSVGGNIQGKVSNNGSTWTAYTAAFAIGVTPVYLTITRFLTTAFDWTTLHRLNVYPGPTFFPG
ncbi:MAG: hypothetical protein ACYDAK_05385 [Candidatus Limnocylindrales bacterium]